MVINTHRADLVMYVCVRPNILNHCFHKVDESGRRCLEYTETFSKTLGGGLKSRKQEPKVTRAYENVYDPTRCPVEIYLKYISLW